MVAAIRLAKQSLTLPKCGRLERMKQPGPTSPIALIGIDVDGTLVRASGQVAPEVWAAADRTRRAGIRLTLCSGRPAFGVALDYARHLHDGGWHVLLNGASVVNLATGESRSAQLPAACVTDLIGEARRQNEILE